MCRHQPRAAAVVLLALLAGAVLAPIDPPDVHAGYLLVPDDWRQAHPGPYTITVAVLLDDEWIDRFGTDAQRQAEAIIRGADRYLQPAGIHLRAVGYDAWVSPNGAPDIVYMLDALEAARQPESADVVMSLVAGYQGQEGGGARLRQPHVVVKHHRHHPERDAYVLAHELAHVLGLSHHSCPDGLCIMADHEYDPRAHWCQHHLDLLRANAGYFQYIAGPTT